MFSPIAYFTWEQHHQNHWSLSTPVRQITICQEQFVVLSANVWQNSAYKRKKYTKGLKKISFKTSYSDVYSPYVRDCDTFELFMYFFSFSISM
jgi:hypothetical protein